MPLALGSRASHEPEDARREHEGLLAALGREAGDQHPQTAPRERAPGGRDRAQLPGIGLVIGQHEAPEAVAGEPAHDLHDQSGERRLRQGDGTRPALGERARPVWQGGREYGLPARAREVGREPPRQRLGAEPVHQERQVWAMLFHRAEREQDDGASVARQRARRHPGALGEADEASTGAAAGLHGGIL
jgi:hypothetical protein